MIVGTLDGVLETLRNHETELRRLGVSHAVVFGSVAKPAQTAILHASPASGVLVCGKLVRRMITGTLDGVLETLRNHESELRRLGVSHAAVFGSVARREARADSDIDVLVELDPDQPMGMLEYARLKLDVNEILDGSGDVVNRRTLKPLLRDGILHDAVYAF